MLCEGANRGKTQPRRCQEVVRGTVMAEVRPSLALKELRWTRVTCRQLQTGIVFADSVHTPVKPCHLPTLTGRGFLPLLGLLVSQALHRTLSPPLWPSSFWISNYCRRVPFLSVFDLCISIVVLSVPPPGSKLSKCEV